MEMFGGVLGAIVIAILISLIFYFALGARGPWGTFWTFFLVLLFAIWAASIWVTPVGPIYWGVSWIPLFFVGLVIALLLAAVPTSDREVNTDRREEEEIDIPKAEEERRRGSTSRTAATVTGFFWLFLLILLLAIIIGYFV